MDPITFITHLVVVLLIGIFCSLLADKLGIQKIMLLLFAGVIIGHLSVVDAPLIDFPPEFLTAIAIIALAIIVFDASSNLNIHQFDAFSVHALRLSLIFLFLNSIFLTLFTVKFFALPSPLAALLFAFMMSGTAPDSIISLLKSTKNKAAQLLSIESVINSPLTVLLPFILIDFITSFEQIDIFSTFVQQIGPFLQQFVSGIGSGIVVGIVISKVMKKQYSETISPLAIITAALLAYVLAENLGGNGVLAVTTLGLFIGHVYVSHRVHIMEIASFFANSLEILVFVLIGVIIKFPLDGKFIITSLALFAVYLVIRFVAIEWSCRKIDLSGKEKIFMALNSQKGIAVAVVAFSLSTLNLPGLTTILHLTIVFMLYSIILSTVVAKASKIFLGKKLKPEH
ncbi:MAG: cation:proton antiporter [Nanoarchaeota archaeon]|nr:cation:proton antiporter [Nanoarchaeota archaeon]